MAEITKGTRITVYSALALILMAAACGAPPVPLELWPSSQRNGQFQLVELDDGRIVFTGDDGIRAVDPNSPDYYVENIFSPGATDFNPRRLDVLPDQRAIASTVEFSIIWNPNEPNQLDTTTLDSTYVTIEKLSDDRFIGTKNIGYYDDGEPKSMLQTVEVDNLDNPTETGITLGGFHGFRALSDGRIAATHGNPDGSNFQIWDLENPTAPVTELPEDHTISFVDILAVLEDDRIVTITPDSKIHIWDPKDLEGPLFELDPQSDVLNVPVAELPDGRLLTGNSDSNILLWDPETSTTPIAIIEIYDHIDFQFIEDIIVLNDGRIASITNIGNLRVWNLDDHI